MEKEWSDGGAYWEDEGADEERDDRGDGGAQEPSDQEALQGGRRGEAEDQRGSIENRNVKQGHGRAGYHCRRLRKTLFFHCFLL